MWIPRYTYKITYNNPSDRSQGGTIAVRFSIGTTDDTSVGYLAEPAFTFGSTQLKGIWVGKFEASPDNDVDMTTAKVQIKPGIKSWRGTTIGNTNAGNHVWDQLSISKMFDLCLSIKQIDCLAILILI